MGIRGCRKAVLTDRLVRRDIVQEPADKLGMVEQIERLDANVERYPLVQIDALHERRVPIIGVIQRKFVAASVGDVPQDPP